MVIAVYAEGPSEWYAIYQLHRRDILNSAQLYGNRNNLSEWLKNNGSQAVQSIASLPKGITGVLLLYDLESAPSPVDEAQRIFGDAAIIHQSSTYENVFWADVPGRRIVLHLSMEKGPTGNRDFDGYVVNLIHEIGYKAVQLWFENGELPRYLIDQRQESDTSFKDIHDLGTNQIPELMKDTGWSIAMSKGFLYSYITSLQLNKSHVWFTEKFLKYAPRENLESVFASLIEAWNLLTQGDSQ